MKTSRAPSSAPRRPAAATTSSLTAVAGDAFVSISCSGGSMTAGLSGGSTGPPTAARREPAPRPSGGFRLGPPGRAVILHQLPAPAAELPSDGQLGAGPVVE